jgi:hypothetical protein
MRFSEVAPWTYFGAHQQHANPQNYDRLTDWDKGTLLKNAARSDREGGRGEGQTDLDRDDHHPHGGDEVVDPVHRVHHDRRGHNGTAEGFATICFVCGEH